MDYLAEQRKPTKHLIGVGLVILLHILIIYALVNGLATKVIEVIRQPLETKIIEEVKPKEDLPPPPPPKLAPPPPPFIPLPEIQIQAPAAAQANTITAVTNVKPVEAPPKPVVAAAPPPPVPRTAPVIDAAKSCTPPEYPAQSRRLQETGAVLLRFLIDVDGKVLDSKVETSSGHDRLDQAALGALSRCRFKPGTVGGKPEQSWANLRYVWKLQ